MAPEVVHKVPYDYRVDIWSLGVLLFELIHRAAPYRGRSLPEITKSLATKTINFSASTDPQAKDLILNILKHNPTERLSLQQIFSHPWVLQNLGKHHGPSKQPSMLQSSMGKAASSSGAPIKKISIYIDQQVQSIDPVISLTPSTVASSVLSQTTKHLNISQSSGIKIFSAGNTPTSELNSSKRKRRIFPSEPSTKETALTSINSDTLRPLAPLESLDASSKDKENNDLMSFSALSNFRRREKISPLHPNLTYINLHQQQETPSSKQSGQSVDRMKRRNIFEEGNSSPPPKFKLADIVSEISDLKQAPYQITKENPKKPLAAQKEKPQLGIFTTPKNIGEAKSEVTSPQLKTRPPLGQSNRSFTQAFTFERKQRSAQLRHVTSHPSGLSYFNQPHGPWFHKGDDMVPSLKGSFSGATLPPSTNTQTSLGDNSPSSQMDLNCSNNEKNMSETDCNPPIKTEDDQIQMNISFSQFYNAIKAKKKLDFCKAALVDK